VEYAMQQADRHSAKAASQLMVYPDSQYKSSLLKLVDFITVREI